MYRLKKGCWGWGPLKPGQLPRELLWEKNQEPGLCGGSRVRIGVFIIPETMICFQEAGDICIYLCVTLPWEITTSHFASFLLLYSKNQWQQIFLTTLNTTVVWEQLLLRLLAGLLLKIQSRNDNSRRQISLKQSTWLGLLWKKSRDQADTVLVSCMS